MRVEEAWYNRKKNIEYNDETEKIKHLSQYAG